MPLGLLLACLTAGLQAALSEQGMERQVFLSGRTVSSKENVNAV